MAPKKQATKTIEEQEISILNGMIQFSKVEGLDPSANMNDFYTFLRKSMLLEFDFSKHELSKKLVQMKNKYKDKLIRADEGSNPEEKQIFKMSKQVWGAGGAFASVGAATELCLKEMVSFHEDTLEYLKEDVIKERLKLMNEGKRSEYKRKLNEIELLEMKLNMKRAQIVESQTKILLDATK